VNVATLESTYAAVCCIVFAGWAGQENIGSGGRLQGLFDQFEQVIMQTD
jgi:hypothetical protein